MTIKTLSGSYANGYTLAAKYSGVSITNAATVTSAQGAPAAYYSGDGGAAGAALTLPKGGGVFNDGHVQGGRGGSGGDASIYDIGVSGGRAGAGGAGVVLDAVGSITNRGSVVGGTGGVGGAGSPGYVYAGGGMGPGGDGGAGGVGGQGVVLAAGGSMTNLGMIAGGAGGSGGAPGNIYAFYGVDGAGGTGVVLSLAGTVTNLGVIAGGDGAYAARDGAGIVLSHGGVVTNGSTANSTAAITGDVGVAMGGAGTVMNFGTIQGTGGPSVSFGSAADRLIAEKGSVFIGEIAGGGGALELAAASGTISGIGGAGALSGGVSAAFTNFGAFIIDAGTSWALTGKNTVGGADNLVVKGDLTVGAGSLTNFSGGTLTGGAFRIGPGGVLQLPDNAPLKTLDATIVFGGAGGVVQSRDTATSTEVGLQKSLTTIGASGVLAVTTGGYLVLTPQGGALTNGGLLEVAGSTLVVMGAVSGSGSARIIGGLLDFTSSFNQNVAFSGAGELELANSRNYAATISGFSHTNATKLDLRDIGFVKANEAHFSGNASGGILTVSDGTHTARIHLSGNYTGATFTAMSDGHGGTIVVDPPASGAAAVSRFADAMAGFGARHAAMATPVAPPAWQTAAISLTAPTAQAA